MDFGPESVRQKAFLKKKEELGECINDLINELNPVPSFDYVNDEVIRGLENDALGTDKCYQAMIHKEVVDYIKDKNEKVKEAVNTNALWHALSERLSNYSLKQTPSENNIKKITGFCVYTTSRALGIKVIQERIASFLEMSEVLITYYAKEVMKSLLGKSYERFWGVVKGISNGGFARFFNSPEYQKLMNKLF